MTFAVCFAVEMLGAHIFTAAMCCSVFGALYSEICARCFKVPATVFLVPTIISIVPGGALYYTMSALISGDNTALMIKGFQTLYISAGLAVGIIIIALLFAFIAPNKRTKKY